MRLGRPLIAVGTLLVGAVILIACQVLLRLLSGGPASEAATTSTRPVQAPITAAPSTAGMVLMPAAMTMGDFEPASQVVPMPQAAEAAVEDAPAGADQAEAAAPAGALVEHGIASTYGTGDGFQGRRTACGQVFDTSVVQVAHKTLPCGSTVRVEDTATGQSVIARVTDRGPYVKGRVVDLSWAAFRQLHPAGPDLLQVNVYLLQAA